MSERKPKRYDYTEAVVLAVELDHAFRGTRFENGELRMHLRKLVREAVSRAYGNSHAGEWERARANRIAKELVP